MYQAAYSGLDVQADGHQRNGQHHADLDHQPQHQRPWLKISLRISLS